MKQQLLAGAAILFIATPAIGHHSNSALDMSSVTTIEGTVIEYSLRNPHSYFVVETTNQAGETVSWDVQMGSANSVMMRGWTRDTLETGDRVVVGVHAARDGRPYGLIASAEKDGQAISYETLAIPELEVRTATTLEGVWIADRDRIEPDYPGGLDELMTRDLVLTDAGREAAESFDQNSLENPALSCITKPTPGGLVYTDLFPMQIEFVEEQQLIMIRSQYVDQERTVYMDGRPHPPQDQRTHEGHSIGRWEGDVLVVDTANFADDRSPYQNGVPSGPQKHVVERYELIDGGTHIRAEFTLEDPQYIVGTMSYTRDLRYAPQLEMTPFNCDLESTRRYLPPGSR
jgi:hypothetical protein